MRHSKNGLNFIEGRERGTTWPVIKEILGVTDPTIQKWKTSPGCPQSIGGVIDGKAVMEFIMARPTKGKGYEVQAKARGILNKFQVKGESMRKAKKPKVVEAITPQPPITTPPPAEFVYEPDEPVLRNTQRGVVNALERLRDAELQLAELYSTQLRISSSESGATFRQWKDAIDQLRKLESEVLDIEVKKKNLISMDEAQQILSAQIAPVRSKLLLFPAQVSHDLENRDASEIQEILNNEIHTLLQGFSDSVVVEDAEAPNVEE